MTYNWVKVIWVTDTLLMRRVNFIYIYFLNKGLSKISSSLPQVGQDGVRFAVVKYSTTAYVEFLLDAYNDNGSLTERVLGSPYIGGRTNIAAALELTRTSVFQQQNGDRNHVPNVAILVTDGIPNERQQDTLMEADLLKGKHCVCCLSAANRLRQFLNARC